MLRYKITLKGLKPNAEEYITEILIVCASTEFEIEAFINDAIYELRNRNKYYQMKYISKELYNGNEECTCGIKQV
ncbi:hypothetical protein [Yersinia phage fHe-Yen9-04]|uniref:Uncharacterized protein n=2 Tax=Eneladusvirus Yen904 TaxID=2560849 RepID=A0A2C9CY67_9CAUD|nr:hypothetical protein FDJ41_gp390 [Yersinia phage fHe-Yen9-04]SOK58790.1 hypothetical protein [Yersinia phage fHe-Yen9-04]SOK59328.1 hypothetical protein [Yersinia phage fHe-Yen9-03]VUE36559.1 hypothetical protein [Yersinia phage fHe-Yen9-04]